MQTYDPVQNNKQVLFNDVSILLRETEVGFRADEVDGIGHSFVNAIVDTKFNLTPSVYLVCDIPDDHLKSFY